MSAAALLLLAALLEAAPADHPTPAPPSALPAMTATATPTETPSLLSATPSATIGLACLPLADLEELARTAQNTLDQIEVQMHQQQGALAALRYLATRAAATPTPQ